MISLSAQTSTQTSVGSILVQVPATWHRFKSFQEYAADICFDQPLKLEAQCKFFVFFQKLNFYQPHCAVTICSLVTALCSS